MPEVQPSVRQRKISELLRREISTCLQRNFALENGAMLYCASARVTKDLKSADIFLVLSKLDKLEDKSENYKKIHPSEDFKYLIKTWIAQNTALKSVPALHFYQVE